MESWIAYWIGVSQNWVAGIIAVAAMAVFKSWNNRKWTTIKTAEVKRVKSGLIALAVLNVLMAVCLAAFSAWVVMLSISGADPLSKIEVASISFFSALFVKFLDDIFTSSLLLYRALMGQY